MDQVTFRVPTGPQYSYYEITLEFSDCGDLNRKIDDLQNGLLVKLAAVVETATTLANLSSPEAQAALSNWERGSGKPDAGKAVEESYADEAAVVAAVARELGASEVPDAPWDQAIPEETRPAPPWAAAPSPVKSAPVDFDNF